MTDKRLLVILKPVYFFTRCIDDFLNKIGQFSKNPSFLCTMSKLELESYLFGGF